MSGAGAAAASGSRSAEAVARAVHDSEAMASPTLGNQRTGLVAGLPMTTAAYNAGNPFAVVAGTATSRKAGAPCWVLCHRPRSFDWRARHARAHPSKRVEDAAFAQVLAVLNQILALA
jgi:mRNA interferase MazF